MKKITLISTILLFTLFSKGQNCDSLNAQNYYLYLYNIPFDSLPACMKDTVQIYMMYVDTTMTQGMRTIKVNGVYKNFRYRFPVNPEVKYKVGYGVKLKKNTGEIAIINPNQNDLYHGFSFGRYLDEIKRPMPSKYLIILAIGTNYEFYLPDPDNTND